jgi:hypothetical protein
MGSSPDGQNKDYEIGMCCFSAKHAALRRKSKDWLEVMILAGTQRDFNIE